MIQSQNGNNGSRIGLPEAMDRVLNALNEGVSYSISKLSRKTGLDRRTVDKVVDILLDVQKTLKSKTLTKKKAGRSYAIKLRNRIEHAKERLSGLRRKSEEE
ncbi:MAG: hypothetical protein KGY80_09170 [Candidatus Thorarchaeota archaeon]|nr:hypothetical protein [Candidatus Thorarchaeota archaeon]